MPHDSATCQICNDQDSLPLQRQSAVYDRMRGIENRLEDLITDLRLVKAQAAPAALKAYGGNGYLRHLALAITNLEQGMQWIGGVIDIDAE